MSTLESLPDGVLCHIVSFILCELRKLPLVCIRFREICMMPHWYTKFVLELNPTRFIINDSSLPLSFECGNKNQVIICNPYLFISSSFIIPWQHFSVFDLHLIPNKLNNNNYLQQCINIILPYFNSIEISPTTKKQTDIIYFNDNLFNNKQYESVYHLSLNGKIQYESTSKSSKLPGINKLFINIFPNIQYLELNYISYPSIDWITSTISSLSKLIILDLWRCEWKEQSIIKLNKNIELFRIFNCTLNTRFNFKECNNMIRVISTDCSHCLYSTNLLIQIANLLQRYENKEKLEILLSHIRDTSKCIKVLKKMLKLNISKLYIVYTRDMYKIFDDLQENITKIYGDHDYNDYNDDNNDNYYQFDQFEQFTPITPKKKKKNKKITILQQQLSFNNHNNNDNDIDIDIDIQNIKNNKEMTVIYGKLNVNLFAASKNYSLFRKLLKIGRLRGTFLWQQ